MKTLVYANTPEKAREVGAWVTSLSAHVPFEVTVQTIRDAGPQEVEAARILTERLSAGAGVRSVQAVSGGGSPEEVIAARAAEGDFALVALAPAGRNPFIRLFYGSMVAHVVRRVSTSILVVRSGGPAGDGGVVPPRRILVCVSGSRHSLTNVTVAAHLAGLYKADLDILTVLSQVSLDGDGSEAWDGEAAAFLKGGHPLAAHLRVASEVAKGLGVTARIRVRTGLVVEEIVAEVGEDGHDLLVIGTHRAEDFDTVYEDITDELVKSSPISTLVVGLRAVLF